MALNDMLLSSSEPNMFSTSDVAFGVSVQQLLPMQQSCDLQRLGRSGGTDPDTELRLSSKVLSSSLPEVHNEIRLQIVVCALRQTSLFLIRLHDPAPIEMVGHDTPLPQRLEVRLA